MAALLNDAGFAPLNETGWIQVTGSDRVRWLNGMVTNSIQALAPGQGCYNFALNSQGRIKGDMIAFSPPEDPETLLLETDREQIPALMAHLDHFIIMDDVELIDVTAQQSGVLITGREAPSLVKQLGLAVPETLVTMQTGVWNGSPVTVIRANGPLLPRFEIWAVPEIIEALLEELLRDTAPLSHEVLEYIRVLEGRPRYGVDIRDTDKAHDLPQETAAVGAESPALHFAKGCYLGQEIVERIRSRGNVHRAFSGFELNGAMPAAGTVLHAEAKTVGDLTSIVAVPLPGKLAQLALGYIRREALDRKLPLEYSGGTATPVSLPYRAALPGSQI